jgi:hypothetical protein
MLLKSAFQQLSFSFTNPMIRMPQNHDDGYPGSRYGDGNPAQLRRVASSGSSACAAAANVVKKVAIKKLMPKLVS